MNADECVPLRERLYSDPPVPTWRKVGYSLGTIPKAAVGTIINVYFNPFLLDVAGLPAGYVSVVTFTGRLLDAITDPICGYIISRSNSRIGKFRPWLLATTPFILVFYLLLWYVPPISDTWKMLYYLIVYYLLAVASTLYAIPFIAMVLTMSNSQKERDSVVTYRMTFDGVGVITGLLIHGIVLTSQGALVACIKDGTTLNADNPEAIAFAHMQEGAHALSSWIVCGLILIGGLIAFFVSLEHYQLHSHHMPFRALLHNYAKIVKYKPFRILLGCIACIAMGFSVTVNNYALYYKHVLMSYNTFPFLIFLIYGVGLLCVPLWQRIMYKFGKKTSMNLCLIPIMLLMWCHLFLRFNLALMLVVSLVFAVLVGAFLLLPSSMLLDVLSGYSVDHGHGKEPLFYSTIGFTDKLFNGTCIGLTTLALQLADYKNGDCEQPAAVSITLRLVVGAFPVLIFLISLLFLWKYPINEQQRQMMRDGIKRSLSQMPKYGSVSKKSTAYETDNGTLAEEANHLLPNGYDQYGNAEDNEDSAIQFNIKSPLVD